MSSRRAVQVDRRAAVQLSAALLSCLLVLALSTFTRSPTGEHHVARAKAVVGVATSHVQFGHARSDQHAVAVVAAPDAGPDGFTSSVSHPVARPAARAVDTPRVRGPPGRAA